MTIRNLEGLFLPSSIAITGPSRLPEPAFELLLARLAQGDYRGPITVVGCGRNMPDRFKTKRRLEDVAEAPDLVILAGRPEHAPGLIDAAGRRGTRAAVCLSAGYEAWDADLLSRLRFAAKPHTLRILGPGSLGFASPHAGIAAHIAATAVAPGELAILTRSSAVLNASLSFAAANRIGFSAVASLGQRTDIDVSDLLDWFALDYRTKAILVHLETIDRPAKFLSAARAAARSKPVIVMRSGRSRDRCGQGSTHAGRLAAPDKVFEAALQRAGILRVGDLDELFEAAETVSRLKPVSGRRMAIMATGGSLATIAADQLESRGGVLAELDKGTIGRMAPLLRAGAPARNPLIIDENAPAETFEKAVAALLDDPESDGVLLLAAPSALQPLEKTAAAIAKAHSTSKKRQSGKKALAVTLAAGNPLPRAALDEARIPCYGSSADAIRSLMHLACYMEAKTFLMAAPPSLPVGFSADVERARATVRKALGEKRTWLDPLEVREILSAYGIPQLATHVARTIGEIEALADGLLAVSDRLALKISSQELPFKSDVGGVVLDLASTGQVIAAAKKLAGRLAESHPGAKISGFVLQPMKSHPHAAELFIGLADDPVFGPAILFGQGGTGVEILNDTAIDLPPLDLKLAEALIRKTRVCKLLEGYRNRPQANIAAVALTLVKLSQIAIDIPEIREVDINPLIADAEGVLAVDARISVAVAASRPGRQGRSRLAIAPYPKEWEQTLRLKDGSEVFVRPVRPEDEEPYRAFFHTVTPEDLRLRFFAPVKDFNHSFLAQLIQLDYSRAMAFAAFDKKDGKILGVVRLHTDPDHKSGEYAILVGSSLKGRGLGWALMQLIIRYAAADGVETIKGEVLKENTTMLAMCEALGFSIRTLPDDDAIAEVTLPVKIDTVEP